MMRLFALVMCGIALLPLRPQAQVEDSRALDPADLSADWQAVVEAIQAVDTLKADFEEQRTFSFRPEPVIVEGVLRFATDAGVSLSYDGEGQRIVIVDESGILLRDGRGRSRSAPPEVAGALQPLRAILRLDLTSLAESFALRGSLSGEDWRLELKPLEDARARLPRFIAVAGTGGRVTDILVEPSPRQQIRILVQEATAGVVFSEEERQRYFR